MRTLFLFIGLSLSFSVFSQHEGDTVYKRCPIFITDTATGNNYFLEVQPATVKAYRNGGNFTIVIEQKSQFFSMFFHERKLRTKGRYNIAIDAGRGELRAKYSFKSGESAAFIDVSSGTVETTYDKVTKLWHIKVNGLIANLGDTKVTYFKAKADFFIK